VRRLPAGRILAWFGGRLRAVRYLLSDIAFAIGRVPRSVGRGVAGFWGGLSLAARRRLAAAVAVAVALGLFVALAVPNLPCQFPGGDSCPPADDLQEIVPGEALAYLHANVDPDSEQFAVLREVASTVPLFSQQIAGRALALIPGPEGGAPDFLSDLEPWFGGELGVAVLAESGEVADQVLLVEVDDTEGATSYAEAIASGRSETEEYEGVELSVDGRGVATAQVEGFLAVGAADGVRAVIDTATEANGTTPLADNSTAEEVRDELPDHRFAEAWISSDGAERLVAGSDDLLGSLSPLLSPGTTEGAAVSLSAATGAIELAVRSALDPEREEAAPSFFSAFPKFEPSLPEELSTEALAYVGFGDPETTVSELLAQAAADAPGIVAGFEGLVGELRRDGEIDLERELLPALGDEAAFAIEPAPEGGDAPSAAALPYLEFVADGVNEDRAARALAALQGPLAETVDPGGLQVPVFGETEVDGVEVRSLRVSPVIEIAYAVFDELAVVATDPAGIEQLATGDGGLDGSEDFERATEDFPDEVSLLAYLDLRTLLAEGFEIGLAQVPAFNTFAGEFRRLDSLALAVSGSDELLATDARVVIEAPERGERAPAQVPPASD
jgi:hypothetical protein